MENQNIDMNITEKNLPVIAFNFDELKAKLTESMQHYNGLIVTETTLSDCKAEQKELAGLRTKIDKYRKEVKAEMSKPISEFEDKCKQLVELVEDAEKPLKEAIKEFDDKTREEKKKAAEAIIKEAIEKYKLEGEFAAELTVLEQYCNLSASKKSVKEDIEQRAFLAFTKQQVHKDKLNVLQATIENVNKTISVPLSIDDFAYMIRSQSPVADIIAEINKRAERIIEAEKKAAEKAEEKAKETIAAAPPPSAPAAPIKQDVKPNESIWVVDFRIKDSKANLEALSKFLIENNYNYEVMKKEKQGSK